MRQRLSGGESAYHGVIPLDDLCSLPAPKELPLGAMSDLLDGNRIESGKIQISPSLGGPHRKMTVRGIGSAR